MSKIAAALLRVSSNQQELDSQKDAIEKTAKQMGYTIPNKFYFGEKISGGRPQFIHELDEQGQQTGYLVRVEDSESLMNLKEACQNPKTCNQIEMIFIWEISRLSRRKSSLFTHLEFFNTLKKPIYFINHKITTLNLFTLEVDKMADANILFLSGYIEEEYRSIKERTQRGKQYVFENDPHRYVGGRMLYGYKIVQRGNKSYIEINEDEAETVRLIFDKYVNKKWSYVKIASYLNSKKIYTSLGYSWDDSNIGRILHSTNYIGERHYGKWKGTVPAIISKELFTKVADVIIDKRELYGRKTRKFNYPLKPLIQCGICKSKLQGVICASRKLYYDEHVNVNTFRADAIVWDVLQRTESFEWYILNQSSNKIEIENEIKDKEDLLLLNDKNIQTLQRQKTDLLKLIRKGFSANDIELEANKFDVDIRNYTKENTDLKNDLKYLNERLETSITDSKSISKLLKDAGKDINRVEYLIKLFITEIYVYNPLKNWVLIRFRLLGKQNYCFFNRQSKRNIYYTLYDTSKAHPKYLYSRIGNFFSPYGENQHKSKDEYIFFEDIISNIDDYSQYTYEFIQDDIFSCKLNENERAKHKRWNEQRKRKN